MEREREGERAGKRKAREKERHKEKERLTIDLLAHGKKNAYNSKVNNKIKRLR